MLEEKRQRINTIFKEIDSLNYQHLHQENSEKQLYDHKENIDYLVDKVLEKNKVSSCKEKTKLHHNRFKRRRINRKSIKIANKKILAILLSIILLSVAFLPIITSTNSNDPPTDITIINVYSYPSIGGNWTVTFTTIGRGNLIISAVNDTTWNDTSEDYDLKFLEIRSGNETLEYEWINNSVFIENYSSDEIGYEACEVLTSGKHTLMFQFGNDLAYAFNYAFTWWNTSFGYRKLITINSSQISADLTNFPVLVNITDTDLRDDAQNNGNDIAFTNSTGVKLNHEIDSFNGATGELFAWVNVTSLSSASDTEIYMYYGNSSSGAQENPTGVWDSNYLGVWHMNQTNPQDSTSNDFDGTSEGSQTTATGKIGTALNFDGGNDEVNLGAVANCTTAVTVSAWVKVSSLENNYGCVLEKDGWATNVGHYGLYSNADWLPGDVSCFQIYDLPDGVDDELEGSDLRDNSWCYLVGTWDDGTDYIRLFENGSEADSLSGASGPITGTSGNVVIGNRDGDARWLYAVLDEVRISNIARNAAWINTCYNNQYNQSTFVTIGSEQNVTDTSVDKISPYTVTYSPYTITATAASSLNNITLYYRYSIDNSSWGSNVSWIDVNNPDTESPWQWNFNFSNGTGYYEFYSIGKLSGLPDESPPDDADAICYFNASLNTAPNIVLISPAPNGTTGVIPIPNCQIWANDSDGDTLTVYWYENTTLSWVLKNTSVVSPNSSVNYTFTEFSDYYTTYWWKVAVNDSEDNTTATYYFTTEHIGTSVDVIIPYAITSAPLTINATGPSNLDNVKLYYRWSSDNITWGTKDVSIFDGFESGSMNASLWDTYQTPASDARIQFNYGDTTQSGSNACAMDDFDADVGDSASNELYTVYDFAGASNINIDFWQYDADDEETDVGDSWSGHVDCDAVSFTNDGNTWYEIIDAASLNSNDAWSYYTYNISNDPNFDSDVNSSFAIKFQQYDNYQIDIAQDWDGRVWDDIYINFTGPDSDSSDWMIWSNISNPDTESPWSWNFDFPNSTGYYEFYSIGNKTGSPDEAAPASADAICYAPFAAPIVTTNASTGIEETNVTLRGYLLSDGASTTACGFRYGTSSGDYSENFTKGIYSSNTEFSNDNGSLTQGQIYFYQAWASNALGFANGTESVFLTKPDPPTNPTVQTNSSSAVYLKWTNGTGANNTYIERNASGVSVWTRGEGTVIYNNSGTNCEDTGLAENVTYYYQAWSYTNWTYNPTLHQWSDNNASASNTTNNIPKITNPEPNNGSIDINVMPQLNITINDPDGDNMTITWYSNSSGSWQVFDANNSVGNGTYRQINSNFSDYNKTYWWNVTVTDGMDTNVSWYYFTTRTIETSVDAISPYVVGTLPLNITATGNSDLDNVTLFYRWSSTNWTSNWTTLTYDDFEADWGNYTDGGADCELYTGGIYAHQGNNAGNIQDDSGDASSFYHTTGIDVDIPGYNSILVDFWFTASTGGGGWQNGEDWFVEYYNGSGWNIVATYVYGTDFTVGPFYHETVWINETDHIFPTDMQIKFRCDASGNNDDIYIDEIYVNATPANRNWTEWINSSNPDTSYPWSWDFNFPNSTGYYEFYSIGNKTDSLNETAPVAADAICYYDPSVNYAPIINVIYPENGSTDVTPLPTCQIWANDSDGDTLTVYWYENTTGDWVLRNTNSSVSADSIVSYNFPQFNKLDTTYWWKVAVNDSIDNTSKTNYFTTIPINTSVDQITPYVVKISPLTINATGASDLTNVTLYYRWSDNNFTGDQWANLSYDDFESGFGNYTDGGADCELYTGGTYAHQGSNAANIQDDSGDESSFYHTTGIDVHNPEYKSIKVDFWFRAEDMDPGHDFFVEYFDGGGWNTVATYVSGTDFVNSQFYHEIVWINETSYTFPSNMQIKFRCDALNNNQDVYIDQIYVNATSNNTNWTKWSNINNPDTSYPWNWTFDFPYGKGYYEFYSIGRKTESPDETPPASKDAACYYPPMTPVINSYDLRNVTGSKLNNATGLLDVNREYYFTINVTDANSWTDIEYINISAWFDNGSESTTYNNSGNLGGNLNMYLQYANTSGSASWGMIWPDDEAQIVLVNCTETIINETTRVINISFIPNSQIRWSPGDGAWDATQNATNDLNSWNFNITVSDLDDLRAWKVDEYGVYRYTSLLPNSDWVDVVALPGQSDDSSVVTITYSSNYDFNMSIYFEENLTNPMWGSTIPIANNVTIKADADLNDDITSDKVFKGIGEVNAIDIINVSGLLSPDNVSQTVDVQFNVYIPYGTLWGKYTAIVASKIVHD